MKNIDYKYLIEEKLVLLVGSAIVSLMGLIYLIAIKYNFDKTLLLISLSITLLLFFIIILLVMEKYRNNELKKITGELINKIANKLESKIFKEKDFYYSANRLADIEKNYTKDDKINIWVFSSDLRYEKPHSIFIKSIKNNLIGGINYNYIIPKNNNSIYSHMQHLIEFIKVEKKQYPDIGSINFHEYENQDLFTLSPYTLIFNQIDNSGQEVYQSVKMADGSIEEFWLKTKSMTGDCKEFGAVLKIINKYQK